MSKLLTEMAEIIGWTKVNDDAGFVLYEYTKTESKYEKISFIVRILDNPNEQEQYIILNSLINVLPWKLKRNINKITKNFRAKDYGKIIEVLTYTIDEYKSKTEYSKLREYGLLVGVDIVDLGYPFEYKIIKSKKNTILAKIESYLPMEVLPTIGKIKKIEYKIAYVKNKKDSIFSNAD